MVLILLKVQNMGAIPSAVKRNLTLKQKFVVEFSCWIPFLGRTLFSWFGNPGQDGAQGKLFKTPHLCLYLLIFQERASVHNPQL